MPVEDAAVEDRPSARTASALLVVLLVLGLALRAWGTFESPTHSWDEADHVESAISSNTFGTSMNMTWTHPPLSLLLLGRAIALLGDNPYGWRLGGVLLGAATILVLYLLGRTLLASRETALLAAALLALDPFHAFFSRSTMMEIPVTFFFLLFVWLLLEHALRGRPTLPLAGLALGLTVATKAYFVLAIPVVWAFALRGALRRGEPARRLLGDYALTQLVLPAAVLLFAYYRWFGRGFTLPDFVQLQLDALRTLREITIERFPHGEQLRLRGEPWGWFVRPMVVGAATVLPDGLSGRFVLEIANPSFRPLVLPALAVVGHRAWRARALAPLLAPALLAAVYLPALLMGRPIFSYSVIPALPFAYLALAHGFTLVAARARHPGRLAIAAGAIVVLWGLYTAPLISGHAVPIWLYRPVLALATIVGGA